MVVIREALLVLIVLLSLLPERIKVIVHLRLVLLVFVELDDEAVLVVLQVVLATAVEHQHLFRDVHLAAVDLLVVGEEMYHQPVVTLLRVNVMLSLLQERDLVGHRSFYLFEVVDAWALCDVEFTHLIGWLADILPIRSIFLKLSLLHAASRKLGLLLLDGPGSLECHAVRVQLLSNESLKFFPVFETLIMHIVLVFVQQLLLMLQANIALTMESVDLGIFSVITCLGHANLLLLDALSFLLYVTDGVDHALPDVLDQLV